MLLYEEFEQEGKNILDFWTNYGLKENSPLFHLFVDYNNEPSDKKGSSFLITARALWTFSTAYEIYGDVKYLETAHRIFEGYPYFYDEENGGYFMFINVEDRQPFKKIYDHAFAIYGLAKYYAVSKNPKALEMAFDIFNIIEEKSYDKGNGGYHDYFLPDWTKVHERKFPDILIKDMNCMLHILEAYTLFYDVTKNERVLDALKKLARITLDKIFNKETNHLFMFFDADFNPISDQITCGHDIETSWLLWETAEVIGDEALKEEIKDVCIKLADSAIKEGIDTRDGGMCEKYIKEEPCNRKIWWAQAETVIGTFNAYQLTGDEKYLKLSENFWKYIKNKVIAKNGEWYLDVLPEGFETVRKIKIAPMKCPYHNFRMCAEMMRRIAK